MPRPNPWRFAPWESRLTFAGVVLSMIVCSLVVLANPYPRGDLEDAYADHLRNTFSSWAFFQVGPRVFREPIGQFGPEVDSRERHMTWPRYPVMYPLGMILLFAPFGAAENLAGVGSGAIGRWTILAILAAAHLTLFAYARGLAEAGHAWPIRWTLLYWLYGALIVFSLDGEYDAAYLFPLVLAFDALRANRPDRAFLLGSLALFVHYRAIAFAPVLVASFVDCARRLRAPPEAATERKRTVASMIAGAVLVLASLATLASGFGSLGRLSVTNPTYCLDGTAGPSVLVLAAATIFPAAALLRFAEPVVALQVTALGGFLLVSREIMLWHLLVLFPLALFPRPRRTAGILASVFFAAWIWLVYSLVGHPPDIRILKDRIEWMLDDSCRIGPPHLGCVFATPRPGPRVPPPPGDPVETESGQGSPGGSP